MYVRRPVPPLSLSNEPRQTPPNEPDYGLLPLIPWLVIVGYLDADSRLAVADLGPNFEALVHGERCMRTVICDANADSASLRSLLEGGRSRHVRALQLTNCVVAAPNSLLACVNLCTRLTQLRCVGCPLDADLLLKVVTKWLPSLRRLEWSLCVRNLRRALCLSKAAEDSELALLPSADSLERVYVEVARAVEASDWFLALFVSLCPNLRRLHVHELHAEHRAAFELARRLAPSVDVFTYSKDNAGVNQKFFAANRPGFGHAAFVNLTFVGGSLSSASCASLGDLVQHRRVLELRRLPNFVLVVPVAGDAPEMLEQAAAEHSLTSLSVLTVVSASKPGNISAGLPRGNPKGSPRGNQGVPPLLARALGVFLDSCRTLTELNLNAFHFEEEIVFPENASGLGQLRALSVAPCALMTAGKALRNLASICARLEDLDVRSNRFRGKPKPPCIGCSSGILRLNDASDPSFDNWRNTLQRVTLCNVQRLGPLHSFASVLKVGELRLCGVDALAPALGSCHDLLRRILDNPYLRSLVIQHDDLHLEDDFLWSALVAARQLRYLCLLSRVPSQRAVVMRHGGDLLLFLPSLVSVHVHYAEVDGAVVVVPNRHTTLVRRARSWLWNYVEDTEPVVLEEDRCVLCCTSTFVGLARPRNRDWCRL
ncbi:uncharacterized protein LOC142558127 [Dermacentor variabilis]|uniref:uncharacterized protein LOC142558127 n=1 Tax=Dermacentor variabilis TaxID=34621 RepID=UPI003F5B38AA